MHFVAIPTTQKDLRATEPLWMPFIAGIAKALGEAADDLIARVMSEQAHIGLVWDEQEKRAYGLVGWQLRQQSEHLVGEVLWLEGEEHEKWEHLLPELEEYLTKHLRCDVIRAMPRPGWARNLKKHNYKLTHYVMEKRYG